MSQATLKPKCNPDEVLFLSMELSNWKWKLTMTTGQGVKTRNRNVDAGDFAAFDEAVRRSKERFGLEYSCPVVSCYEAGRDGFWIHRALEARGVNNIVVDPASVDVNRRWRKKKTDRLDGEKLLENQLRWYAGRKNVWSVAEIPSVEDEDARQFHRELQSLKGERTRHTNRIKSLLVTCGVRIQRIGPEFAEWLDAVTQWDGNRLPPQLRERLLREYQRLSLVEQQIREMVLQRRAAIRESSDERIQKVRKMMQLRSIGENSAWPLVMEFFSWRDFKSGKQLGSLSGLTPTPYASGDMNRELGISKAGNRRIRAVMIELAWCWRRFQPTSELTIWFEQRFGKGSKRSRKVGIVALARRLLIALWRYLEFDEIPAGAVLKT
jgi:transposase